jgi:hypothetical protein
MGYISLGILVGAYVAYSLGVLQVGSEDTGEKSLPGYDVSATDKGCKIGKVAK